MEPEFPPMEVTEPFPIPRELVIAETNLAAAIKSHEDLLVWIEEEISRDIRGG